MAKSQVKNEKMYKSNKYDEKAIVAAYKKKKREVKFPTSIALDKSTVVQLKEVAHKRGIPYQTLMRMLILEGLERIQEAA